ncbi:MAG: hypothetical protein Q8P67_09665 [archaeon]|nr:hypothetical protein [archaeon]
MNVKRDFINSKENNKKRAIAEGRNQIIIIIIIKRDTYTHTLSLFEEKKSGMRKKYKELEMKKEETGMGGMKIRKTSLRAQ